MYKILSGKQFFIHILILAISCIFSYRVNVVPFDRTLTDDFPHVYGIIFRWMKGEYYLWLYRLIVFIFLTVNVYIFAYLMQFMKLEKAGDWFYAFLFLFITGMILPYIEYLPNIMIALSLFLIMLRVLFGTLRKQNALFQLFNVGLMLAISSFFWYRAAYFFPIIFLVIPVLRTIDIRELIAPIIGLVLPYFIMISIYFFVYSNFNIFTEIIQHIQFKEAIPVLKKTDIMIPIVIGFLIMISSFKFVSGYRLMETDKQDFLRIYFILFLISAFVFLIYPGFRFSVFIFACVSITVPIGFLIKETKAYYMKEIYTDILILCLLYVYLY